MRNLLILIASLTTTSVLADNISVPHQFESGQKALATQVNENFSAVVDGVNTNSQAIIDNTASIATKQNAITASCTENEFMRGVDVDGNPICASDQVGAGADLSGITVNADNIAANKVLIDGNTAEINANKTALNSKQNSLLNPSCTAGEFISSITANGNVTCDAPANQANNVAVVAGTGIEVNDNNGSTEVAIANNGVTNNQLAPDSVGSSELQLNAVNSADHILDEPGVTSTEKGCVDSFLNGAPLGCKSPTLLLNTSPLQITEVTVDAPASGFVFLSFSTRYQFIRSSTADEFIFQYEINQSATPSVGSNTAGGLNTVDTNGSYRVVFSTSGQPTGLVSNDSHSQIQIPVREGLQTFYVHGFANVNNTIQIKDNDFTAMYFPTSY